MYDHLIEKYVLVTTDKDRRGVFAGTLGAYDHATRTARILGCRMCVYWSSETHGVLGLASIGPQAGSRISPRTPETTVDGVTSISACTPEAAKAWEAEPWD